MEGDVFRRMLIARSGGFRISEAVGRRTHSSPIHLVVSAASSRLSAGAISCFLDSDAAEETANAGQPPAVGPPARRRTTAR